MAEYKFDPEVKQPFPRKLAAIFLLFSIIIVILGIYYYRYEKARIFKEQEISLSAIASLKINQISQWYTDKLADAVLIKDNEPLTDRIKEFIRDENQTGLRKEITVWLEALNSQYDYNSVAVLDTLLRVRLATFNTDPLEDNSLRKELNNVIRYHKIIMTDLHKTGSGQSIRMDLLVPLLDPLSKEKKAIGLIILCIDPGKILFPLVQSWPTASKSSETLILRREGDSVFYLNDLRHRKNTALNLKFPLNNENLLAVKAVNGYEGVTEGIDYRNVPVIGAISKIPGLPWYMVAKTDKEEILAPFKRYSVITVLVIILLIMINASIFGFWIWQQRLKYFKNLLNSEISIRELEERFTTAFRMSPVSVTISSIHDNKFIDINNAFLKDMGYTREEVIGRTPRELDIWADENERLWIIKEISEKGKIFGKIISYKTKTGKIIYGLSSMSVVKVNGEPCNLSTVVNVTDARTSEKKLADQYFTLKGITESSRGPIFSLNQTYCYTSFNKVHFKVMNFLYGVNIELGKNMLNYQTNDDDRIKAKANLDRALAGEYVEESSWSGEDVNDRRFFEVAHNPIYNDVNEVIGVAVNARDSTERKRIEEKLSESEDKFKYIFEHSVMGNSITLPTGETHYNDAFCRMLGYSREELKNLKWPDFTHPDDFEITQNVIDSITSRKLDSPRFIKRYLKKDRSVLWADVSTSLRYDKSGTAVYFMTTINDITDLKLAEEVLRNDEKRFREMIEALPQLYWTCRVDGPCDYLSKQWIEYTGIPEAEQLDYGWLEQLHPDDRAKTVSEWTEKVKTFDNFDIEFRIRRFDGEYHWFKTRAVPIRNSKDQIVRWLGSNTDIDAIRKAEAQLINYSKDLEKSVALRTEQLEAANKELEAFSYSVSHDLRAPLRSVHGFTKILLEDYEAKLDDEGKRICSIITSSATQMGELIDDLLSFSRIGRSSLNPSEIDMKMMAKVIFEGMTSPTERKRIKLKIGKLPIAFGDVTLLGQVWTNLISNAIKYSSKKDFSEIIIGSKADREFVTYFIKDNGVGFDMKFAHKLFGVFQRLHSESEFEGNGVGLAIVQRIILKHGGKVWAEGALGNGATFFFSLPVMVTDKKAHDTRHTTHG